MSQFVIHLFLLAGLLGSFGSSFTAIRQETIEFRNPVVQGSYPDGITFRIEICGRSASSRTVFNYSVAPADSQSLSWTRESWTIDEGQTADNCDKRMFYLETKELSIPPFAPIQYYWSVKEGSNLTAKSPSDTYYYRDGNQAWKTMGDEDLIVWWHDRPDTFGEELLSIASTAYRDQAGFYSTDLTSPIVIVIANTPEEFHAWQEEEIYAGGLAFPELNLTIQLVEEGRDSYEWSTDVIPHEISHIYFDHLMSGLSYPPLWLDEGVATYLEYSNHYEEWNELSNALQAGQFLPLEDLEYDFGQDEQKIRLAYAESYYAVLYMEEQYGREAITDLLAQYDQGFGTEDAFQKTFGRNPAEFEQDYRAWLEQRIDTPPPNNEIRKPLEKSDLNFFYASMGILCLLPICFVALGMGAILILWKFNNQSSKGKEKSIPS